MGGVQEPLGDTSPSCLKTWGAQAAAAGGPSLEAKAPEAAEGGPSRSPQARTAPASCRKGDASRDGGRRWRGRVTAPGAQPSGALPTCAFFPRPQFLRDSLRTPRGSSWSLRLSKELNNQMQSFDSPSLEKVGPQRKGRADGGTPGTARGRPGRPEAAQAPWAGRRLAGPDPRAVVFVPSCFPLQNLLCWSWGAFPLQSPASPFLSPHPHLQCRP